MPHTIAIRVEPPATKTEWADVKQGVIEVEQNALLGDDVQTLLDDLQADIAG